MKPTVGLHFGAVGRGKQAGFVAVSGEWAVGCLGMAISMVFDCNPSPDARVSRGFMRLSDVVAGDRRPAGTGRHGCAHTRAADVHTRYIPAAAWMGRD